MKKILITGANGFLGQHLALHLCNSYDVIATSRGESRLPTSTVHYSAAELTSKADVAKIFARHSPDIVIHTAALSKPDECAADPAACLDINLNATVNLLQQKPAYFIYVSTDFIFGENGPHRESAVPEPLNFYGESKLMAEQAVRNAGIRFAIMRPAFIYGKVWPGLRPSFLHWVKNNLEQGKTIKVVSDQKRTPTYVQDLCNGLELMVNIEADGDFHLAGRDVLSPHEMAQITANVLGLDPTLIQNVTSDTFPEPVRRSKRSGLTIQKAVQSLGYNPVSFAEGVKLTFADEFGNPGWQSI